MITFAGISSSFLVSGLFLYMKEVYSLSHHCSSLNRIATLMSFVASRWCLYIVGCDKRICSIVDLRRTITPVMKMPLTMNEFRQRHCMISVVCTLNNVGHVFQILTDFSIGDSVVAQVAVDVAVVGSHVDEPVAG